MSEFSAWKITSQNLLSKERLYKKAFKVVDFLGGIQAEIRGDIEKNTGYNGQSCKFVCDFLLCFTEVAIQISSCMTMSYYVFYTHNKLACTKLFDLKLSNKLKVQLEASSSKLMLKCEMKFFVALIIIELLYNNCL